MNCYNIRLEYRLRKSEYIQYRIELVRIKAEKREWFSQNQQIFDQRLKWHKW